MNSRTPGTLRQTSWHGRKPVFAALPALAALVVLTGCGGGGGGSSSSTTVITPVTPTPTPVMPTPTGQSVSAPALSSFTATLSEDQSSISVGGTVNYTFTLANTSATAATVIAETSGAVSVPIVALHVSDPTGVSVYPPISQPGVRPQDSPPAPPASGAVTLQPGQSLVLTRALSVFKKSGSYQAVAVFTVAATTADTPQTVTLGALPVVVK